MKITPEQLYNLYHRKILFYTKNIHCRNIKDFSKQKQTPEWCYFEKLSNIINGSDHINPEIYIDSLIDFYKGYFNLKLLSHPKGIKIYKNYVLQLNNSYDKEKIFKSIYDSIKFVGKYIRDNDIESFNHYLNSDVYTIPLVAKHYYAGSISKHFLALVPDIIIIINSYPSDIINQYFRQFKDDYVTLKPSLISYPKLKKISDNMEKLFEKMK